MQFHTLLPPECTLPTQNQLLNFKAAALMDENRRGRTSSSCAAHTNITIPSEVFSIPDDAFNGCLNHHFSLYYKYVCIFLLHIGSVLLALYPSLSLSTTCIFLDVFYSIWSYCIYFGLLRHILSKAQ